MKRLLFTVTNDLNYDQRMIRICSSLSRAGFQVRLIGRTRKDSIPLQKKPYGQHRLNLWFDKGKLFYLEYNIRLFFYLLFQKTDLICAIDLDTILPCYLVSRIKGVQRVYDAHELFTEMKEVVSRPAVHRAWKWVERFAVPRFAHGYTVSPSIQKILNRDYGVQYEVIRNLPYRQPFESVSPEPFIIYQGAVNEGRGFEVLIPAFQWINLPLHIYGSGNFVDECKRLIRQYGVADKVVLQGQVLPEHLRGITRRALLGVNLVESKGMNHYFSLANRFFDYIQAGIPQICSGLPEYVAVQQEFDVALLVQHPTPESLAQSIKELAYNQELQQRYRAACRQARLVLNWEEEEKRLIPFYQNLFLS